MLFRSCVGIQIVTNPATETVAVHTSTLVADGESLFVVNPDNNTLTAISQIGLETVWETDVCAGPKTVALAPNREVWVACFDTDEVYRLDQENGNLISNL